MGAGPHPGYLSSLFTTGVTMMSALDVAEAAVEADDQEAVGEVLRVLRCLGRQWMRKDRELFPSRYGEVWSTWGPKAQLMWAVASSRIYAEVARLRGRQDDTVREAFGRVRAALEGQQDPLGPTGRLVIYYLNPLYADAMLLGARLGGEGVELDPLGDPSWWPARQTVHTPYGALRVDLVQDGPRHALAFEAERDFPVTVVHGGERTVTSSNGRCVLGSAGDDSIQATESPACST